MRHVQYSRRICPKQTRALIFQLTVKYNMAKKQFFLIVDTETTIADHVADFGAVICDKQGNIFQECGVLIAEFYNTEKLFHDAKANDIWGYAGLHKREENYRLMLEQGSRMLASVAAINRWLERAKAKYSPELTAYNLAFDLGKCANSGIDLSMFEGRFCLWHSAAAHFADTKAYKQFIMDNHAFNAPTEYANMSYKTNAEVMSAFVQGGAVIKEPHTALEDAKLFELPILKAIVKRKKWREKSKAYSWRDYQVRDHFTAK